MTDTESMNVERRGKGKNKPKHKGDEKKNRLNEGFQSRLIPVQDLFIFSVAVMTQRGAGKKKSSQHELVVECTTTTPVSLCPPPPPTHLPQ